MLDTMRNIKDKTIKILGVIKMIKNNIVNFINVNRRKIKIVLKACRFTIFFHIVAFGLSVATSRILDEPRAIPSAGVTIIFMLYVFNIARGLKKANTVPRYTVKKTSIFKSNKKTKNKKTINRIESVKIKDDFEVDMSFDTTCNQNEDINRDYLNRFMAKRNI